jgi:hypothetical protein
MNRKEEAVKLIKRKLNNESFLSYIEIAEITGYHPKYILKLKKEVINGQISLVHGNKNKKPVNAISDDEKNKIIGLYKRSNASIRKFCRFYARRSYSCIYNVIKEYEESLKK